MARSVFRRRLLPALAADPVDRGRGAVLPVGDPALDQVHPVHGHAEQLAARVLDGHRLEGLVADPHLLHPPELAYAVVHVDHVVARLQRGEALQRRATPEAAAPPHAPAAPEDLVVGEHPERRVGPGEPEASGERPYGEGGGVGRAQLLQDLAETLPLALVVAEDDRAPTRARLLAQKGAESTQVAVDRLGRHRAETHRALWRSLVLGGELHLAVPGHGSGYLLVR
jgi:hypothetical protein